MNNTDENKQIIAIGDLARNIGLTTRTLRYWEEVGIIESEERTDGANRGYSPLFCQADKIQHEA